MRLFGLLGILLLIAVALIISYVLFRPDGHGITIRSDSQTRETTYAGQDRSLRLSVREVEPHLLHWRSDSQRPLAEQLAIFDRLLAKLPADGNYTTLFIGRLEKAFGQDRTLANRLKAAAKKRPLTAGNINSYVKTLANEAMIYPELKALFAKHGYQIKIVSVEKVLIDPADKLPFDCLTWFSLEKK